MSGNKKIHVIWWWTVNHIRPHLALSSPAYWETARQIAEMCESVISSLDTELHLTKMANSGRWNLETKEDILNLTKCIVVDPSTKIVFFTSAITDYIGSIITNWEDSQSWKDQPRLSSRDGEQLMKLTADNKIVNTIRKIRKDIFLVSFKTTSWATEDEQYLAGLWLLKNSSSNLVLANDIKTRKNMIITPEEARYHVTTNRNEVLENLVNMVQLRSHLTFTRSTVIAWEHIEWNSDLVPQTLKKVVDYCIKKWAYKPFQWVTVWHFASKINDTTFLTSRRKTNFNELPKNGLVKIETDWEDSVIAYWSKPSVWWQSQRIIFEQNKELDCIVHFHCPIKEGSLVPSVSQRAYECWSHECWENTANNLQNFWWIHAVFLENHWPNIVFSKGISPEKVIEFIEENFYLDWKTGWYVS